MTTAPPHPSTAEGQDAQTILEAIDYIANYMLKLTLQRFSPADAVVCSTLQQGVRLTLAAAGGGSLDLAECAQATLRDVTCACSRKQEDGVGWDSNVWQEAQIFAHLCAPLTRLCEASPACCVWQLCSACRPLLL